MADDNSEAHGVHIGNVYGDIRDSIIAGRDVFVENFNIIRNPSRWPDIVFNFLSNHRAYLVVAALLQLLLFALFVTFRAGYAIPWSSWYLAATLLLFGSWLTYTGWRFGQRRLRSTIATAGNLGVALLIGVHAWQITHPPAFQPQTLGIAVTNISHKATFNLSNRGLHYSDEIYDAICADVGQALDVSRDERVCRGAAPHEAHETPIEIGRFDAVLANSADALSFARAAGAEIVIWGWLGSDSAGNNTIRFEVLETLDQAVNPDFPLIMPVTQQSAGIISERIVGADPDTLERQTARQTVVISSFALGLAAYFSQDYVEAVRHFQVAQQTVDADEYLEVPDPSRGVLYYYLGKSYHQLDRVALGQDWLLQAQALNPAEPAVPLSLALGYANLGYPDQRDAYLDTAMALLQNRLAAHPDDANALYDRALVFHIRDQFGNAAVDFQDLLALNPDFYVAYITLADAAYELGQTAEALAWLQQAIELAAESGANPAWTYIQLGLIYQQEGRLEEARAAYARAVQLRPDNDRILEFYARFLEGRGEYDGALSYFQQMARVSPKPGWAYGQLARFYHRLGLPEQAIPNFIRAINAVQDDPLLHAYLSESYQAAKRQDDARRTCLRAVQLNQALDTEIFYVYAGCANIMFWLGDNQQAVQLYDKALSLSPADCAVLLNQGQVLQALGQNERAAANYRAVLDLQEQCAAGHLDIAQQRLSALQPEGPSPGGDDE